VFSRDRDYLKMSKKKMEEMLGDGMME